MTGHFILTLFNMLRLRSGPQDLPSGWPLAIAFCITYLIQGFVADQALGETDGAPRSLLVIGVQFIVVASLLNIKQFQTRLPQTLSALAGTGFIFGMLSIALLSRLDTGKSQPDLALMYLGLFAWSLAVDAHIYRHALSIKLSVGILLAVLIFAANFVLLKVLFG